MKNINYFLDCRMLKIFYLNQKANKIYRNIVASNISYNNKENPLQSVSLISKIFNDTLNNILNIFKKSIIDIAIREKL